MAEPDPRFADARCLDRRSRRDDPSLWSARSPHGMVATAHYRATAAGVGVLERGGNAIDAAAAASLALAVCEPAGSGLGGMCLMVVHCAEVGRTFTIEAPCLAPARATPELVAASHRYEGYTAVAVPAYLLGIAHALERYGTLSAAEVLGPAIALAEDGFPVTAGQLALALLALEKLRANNGGRFVLDGAGNPAPAGTLFRQPVLAGTLRRLAEHGLRDFYEGGIARSIDADMRQHGGFVWLDDLRSAAPRESEPLAAPWRDATACTLGPPGGGLALVQLLQMLAARDTSPPDPDSPAGAVWLAALIRRARADRKRHRLSVGAGEIDGAAELCSGDYGARALREVESSLGGETSHLCVMDRRGNAIGITQSIERSFGAAVATESLGFLYNGYLKGFKVENRRHPHFLRSGAVARSNAAPTIAVRGGRASLVIGSTSSERLVSGVFQTLVRLDRQDPFAAVAAPRLHATPHGDVRLEAGRFDPNCVRALERHGLTVEAIEPYAFSMGGVQLVVRDGEDFVGVAEPRRDGAAGGPRRPGAVA